MNMKREGTSMLEVLLIKGGNKRSWGLPRAFGHQRNPALWIAFGVHPDKVEQMCVLYLASLSGLPLHFHPVVSAFFFR